MYGMRFERCVVFIDRRTEVIAEDQGTLEVGACSGYYDINLLSKVRNFSLMTSDPLVTHMTSEGALVFCAGVENEDALAKLC